MWRGGGRRRGPANQMQALEPRLVDIQLSSPSRLESIDQSLPSHHNLSSRSYQRDAQTGKRYIASPSQHCEHGFDWLSLDESGYQAVGVYL